MNKNDTSNPRKLKTWLGISIALNVLLGLSLITLVVLPQFVMRTGLSDYALYKSARHHVCDENYDLILDRLQNKEQRQQFATLTCGKHYETGDNLDFSPVLKLIYETNHKLEDINSWIAE